MPDAIDSIGNQFGDELIRRAGSGVPCLSAETIQKLNALDPSILADHLDRSGVPIDASLRTSPKEMARCVFDEATRRAALDANASAENAAWWLGRCIGDVLTLLLSETRI